ncbi:unnamed protein product [Bursaphelenchus xylophilus]|uniref:(pine wood nematode) hypothetical protein n=1 Tax=Bursaphelenchus xylophilus TaxID=6326 RepID=A0A1I7RTC8_BURXY|nr:unnamed protein product [Bursaphelenchus xylophilus]CAG9122500.1 unnamed protein product [Bursaphelenchus xylophilus]
MPSPEQEKLLKQFLECSVCYNSMKDPRMLPCGHRYCFKCCQSCCENDGGNTLLCPECRSRWSMKDLIKDYSLQSFVEKVEKMTTKSDPEEQEEPRVKCSLCKGGIPPGKVYCCPKCPVHDAELVDKLCSDCIIRHHQHHEYQNRTDAQIISIKNLELANADLTGVVERLKLHESYCQGREQDLQLLIATLKERCEASKEIIQDEFQVGYVEKIDVFNKCVHDIRKEMAEFFDETEEKWNQLFTKTLNMVSSNFGAIEGLAQVSTGQPSSSGTARSQSPNLGGPQNVFTPSTTPNRISFGSKMYQKSRKRGTILN